MGARRHVLFCDTELRSPKPKAVFTYMCACASGSGSGSGSGFGSGCHQECDGIGMGDSQKEALCFEVLR